MSIATASTEVINALISAANGVTGNTDTNLTAAIQRLVDGFSAGGGELSPEQVIISQDLNNASDARKLFITLIDSTARFNIFVGDFDASLSGIDNKCQFFIVTVYGEACIYLRFRSGRFDAQTNCSDQYDLNLLAGDKFTKWVIA